jgi:glutaredoxin 3
MSNKRKIEVFSAGCPCCDEAVRAVNSAAGPSDEVEVLDMHLPDVAARAEQYGVKSVPAVAVDGKLAGCCAGRGIDEATLRAEGLGVPRT